MRGLHRFGIADRPVDGVEAPRECRIVLGEDSFDDVESLAECGLPVTRRGERDAVRFELALKPARPDAQFEAPPRR